LKPSPHPTPPPAVLAHGDVLPEPTFRALFEACAVPMALVDARGTIAAVNPALEQRSGSPAARLVGAALGDVVVGLPADLKTAAAGGKPLPAVLRVEGSAGTSTGSGSGGSGSLAIRSCAVHLAAVGADGAVAATILPDSAGNQALVDAALRRVEEQARVQRALFDLSRQITLRSQEEELVGLFARTVRKLLPGVRLCVRLVDARTHALRAVHAEGKLRPEAHARVSLRRSAARGAGLTLPPATGGAVEIVDHYVPVFEDSTTGIDIPLQAGDTLLGALNLESRAGMDERDVDIAVLGTLANQMAVGLRNHRLFEETLYLQRFLENLVESANALIVVVDRERRIVMFNRALEQLTGWRKQDVLGQSLTEWLPLEARGRVLPALIGTMLGEPQLQLEVQLGTIDGKRVPVVLSTAAVHDARGEVSGIIAVGQDLTRLKEMEGRVQHAAKLATLGQVAAGIVHELNNPLTSITATAGMLLKRAEADTARAPDAERLRRVVDAAERIRRFCQDLMTYARPSAGSVQELSLNQVLQEALGFCEHVLKAVEVRVTTSLAPDLPQVLGVRDQLQQVFVNLVTNAAHALEGRPGGELVVSTQPKGSAVEVTISDNGCGIPEPHLARVFEPFFTTKREGKGTGLGLSIAHELVESHGGTIEVRSRVEVGTAFTLTFPAPR
jgi:two-component system NtrC family sensor kinase